MGRRARSARALSTGGQSSAQGVLSAGGQGEGGPAFPKYVGAGAPPTLRALSAGGFARLKYGERCACLSSKPDNVSESSDSPQSGVSV